jgi:uncharacterized protein (TIGR02300 family)
LANPDRGTKREDPDTGKKFYDLNRDPIISPYTGKSYPRSFFEQGLRPRVVERDEEEEEEEAGIDEAPSGGPEIVSLEEADAEESGEDEIPDVEDVEDVEDIGDDDSDVFLEEDEDEEDDLDFDVGGGPGSDER